MSTLVILQKFMGHILFYIFGVIWEKSFFCILGDHFLFAFNKWSAKFISQLEVTSAVDGVAKSQRRRRDWTELN